MRGLMMGRFQPFHLGHLSLAERILSECDELVVAVTSAQFNYMEKDPFTAGERVEMIHDSLAESGADMSVCYVSAIDNQLNIATWGSYLRAALPAFDRVYSGNDYVRMLLGDAGTQVIRPIFLDRGVYNATAIRKMIAAGSTEWGSLVPDATHRILKRINAESRLVTIMKSDTRPVEH